MTTTDDAPALIEDVESSSLRPPEPEPEDRPGTAPQGPQAPRARSLGYVPQLNGLRAVAIGLVVFFHALGGSGISRGGWVGVDVFFVLSGFLITAMLTGESAKNADGRFSLRRFYLRRILRLWPAYLAFLLAVGVYARLAHPHQFSSWAHELFVGLTYRMNFYYLNHDPHTGLGQIWTLCMEEQFYLVWPLVLLVCLRYLSRRATMVVTMLGLAASLAANIALVAGHAGYKRLFFGPDTNAVSLLIGCLLGLAFTAGYLDRWAGSALTRRMPWLLVAALAVWTVSMRESDVWQFAGAIQLLCVIAGLAIVSLVLTPDTWLGRLLANPAIVWVGVLSYSLYLWNQIALSVGPANGPGLAAHAVHYGVQLLLLVELPVISYYVIERRGLRLKDRFETRRATPKHSIAAQETAEPPEETDLLGYLVELAGTREASVPTAVEAT